MGPEPYNLVFSDGLHDPNALINEYCNLKNNKLLNYQNMIYCFDDLEDNFQDSESKMWNSAIKIYNDILKYNKNTSIHMYTVNGWMGEHEHLHNFGVILAE